MTPELIAILGVGIALAGFMWQGLRRIDTRIDRVENGLGARIDRAESDLGARIDRAESDLGARIDRVESDLGARIDRVESGLGVRLDRVEAGILEMRDRLSRLEGKMDLIDGYIMRRNDQGSAAE